MGSLAEVFFSQVEVSHTNLGWWVDFYYKMDQLTRGAGSSLFQLLAPYVERINQTSDGKETTFCKRCPNIRNLILGLTYYYGSTFDVKLHAPYFKDVHLLVVHSTAFLRILLQLVMYEVALSPSLPLADGHTEDPTMFSDFFISSIDLVVKLELDSEQKVQLFDELVMMLLIIIFFNNKNDHPSSLLRNILLTHANEELIRNFFFKLLQIFVGSFKHRRHLGSMFYSGAAFLLNAITSGGRGVGGAGSILSSLSEHSLLLLLFMIFGDSDHSGIGYRSLLSITICQDKTYYAQLEGTKEGEVTCEGAPASSSGSRDCPPSAKPPRGLQDLHIPPLDLAKKIVNCIDHELVALLSYALFAYNQPFTEYFLASQNFDRIVLNISKILYNTQDVTSNRLYVLQLVFLLLTKNQKYINYLHSKIVSGIPWLAEEKRCGSWNVGNIGIFVLVKGLRRNYALDKDMFSHENYMGILSNLSVGQIQLNEEVSNSLVNFLEHLLDQLKRTSAEHKGDGGGGCGLADPSPSLTDNDGRGSNDQPASCLSGSLIERTIAIVMETVNATLVFNIMSNPELIHRILVMELDEGAIVEEVMRKSVFAEYKQNIVLVRNVYKAKFEMLHEASGSINPALVKNHIHHFTKQTAINLSLPKNKVSYDFEEHSSFYLFFLSYLRTLFECQGFLSAA